MYKFPTITHLDEVKKAIEGATEFIIAERDYGFVVNYVMSTEDTFPPVNYHANGEFVSVQDKLNAIRRECRGLIFSPSGRLISRRFHKFFNVNEKPETHQDNLVWSGHTILDKLDGSMITPIPMPDETIRWGSKMGLTSTSMQAEIFVACNPQYQEFASYCIEQDMTPIFEWCSRKNRIVIDYPEDRLVLLAIRRNFTGEYLDYESVWTAAWTYELPTVEKRKFDTDLLGLISFARAIEDHEGFVIRFDSGHMVKVKGDWYVKIHRCKESLSQEKNLIDLIVNEKLDDLKPHLLPDDLIRVNQFEKDFWNGIGHRLQELEDSLNYHRDQTKGDRRSFAIDIAPKLSSIDRGILFACWDGNKEVRPVMTDMIKKSCGSGTRVDQFRSLWGGHRWKF
jgi:T4 RnlA family RNA ligase